MSSSTTSSSNFQLIFDAVVADYLRQTGVNLATSPFVETLQSCRSADDVLDLLQVKAKQFKDYRDGNRKLIERLNPVVRVLHAFSGILGDAASMVPFEPTKVIFSGIDVLLGAAVAVGTSYDALVDMFECVASFLGRLRIYTELPSMLIMSDIVMTIMVEVLSALALATKQIKQGRFKKFAKKLLGESDIEAVLQRLDRLTQDEARITTAQTLQVVCGLVNNMKVVMDDGEASTNGMRQALVKMQDVTNDINKIKRDQLQRDIRSWLSPPDSSTNHNVAWETHHSGSAAWFTRGSTFEAWSSKGSLLWVHGKPGSGKSILCSSIIQEVKEKCDAGLALMCYHYFDFKDVAKQDIRGLLTSLLAQLCAKSDSFNDILSKLYSKNNAGSQQPDNHVLTECLKEMLQLPRQPTIYIIVDALDESPNTSGSPKTAREKVLNLLEELLDLKVSNLRICVTSRPEIDIHDVLGPLASYHMSLHDEIGQRQDIVDYVRTFVLKNREMRRWRPENRQLVIEKLSAKADGMFRWIVCQLEMLRTCFPSSLCDALDELPETLDETYERILLGIEKGKREHAHQLLQCLAESIRPLRVEELAEVLAMRFGPGALPDYHVGWRLEDTRGAVLSACSSLVTIVNVHGSPIVQFSHFSVKEYLTSDRLSKAGAELSRYHIVSLSAHTILAQASLSVLLHLGSLVNKQNIEDFPFAMYAGRHWVDHARFEGVSSRIQDGLRRLFDAENPSFSAWTWIFDIDYPLKEHMFTSHPTRPEALPLYYATLCGFREVVEWLLVTRPGEINAQGGYHCTPLHAALGKGYVEIALLLLERGAHINALDEEGWSVLHIASRSGRRGDVEFLLELGANVNVKTKDGLTPLGFASWEGELDIARVLVQHGAAVDSRGNKGWTPLYTASRYGHSKVAEFLIQSGASIHSRCNEDMTSFYTASLHGQLDVVRLLINSGAPVDSRCYYGRTPLMAASDHGHLDVVHELLDRGADVNARASDLQSPLHLASVNGHHRVAALLIERGAEIENRAIDGQIPLDEASRNGHLEGVRLLLQRGSNPVTQNNSGWTPLHHAAHNGHLETVKLLLKSGANLSVQNNNNKTPLDVAIANGKREIARFLLGRINAVDSQGDMDAIPLDPGLRNSLPNVVQPSAGHGEQVTTANFEGTSLHTASREGNADAVRWLLCHGADVNERDETHKTPLCIASSHGKLDVAKELIKNDAGVDLGDKFGWSPLHVASRYGHLDIVLLLLDHGANVNAIMQEGWSPLHLAAVNGHIEIVRLLLERGTRAEMRNQDGRTAFDEALRKGESKIVELLS